MHKILRSISAHLVGNVQSVVVGGQSDVGLLLTVRSKALLSALMLSYHSPSATYRIRVLTLAASTSYSFLTASLICLLLLFKSTMKTKVLLSSIFFMALSVFNGCWMTRNWSIRGKWGMDFRAYLGFRRSLRVLGRWNEVVVRTFRSEVDWVPFKAAFLANLALASWGLAAAVGKEFVSVHADNCLQNPAIPVLPSS